MESVDACGEGLQEDLREPVKGQNRPKLHELGSSEIMSMLYRMHPDALCLAQELIQRAVEDTEKRCSTGAEPGAVRDEE